MGYTTEFTGQFKLDKPLTTEHKAYLEAFEGTRRMRRDAEKAALLPDPVRIAAGLPIGTQGGYFVGNPNNAGQDRTADILNYNEPPDGQPGLWCQWTPTEDGTGIVWNETEKFYDYTEWLEYLIQHFLDPWGYVLSGEVEWSGEQSEDRGTIHVKHNQVQAIAAEIIHPKPKW